jgi:type II secretory ATPase GspE/PulE/Tfp pilus assembly ATPase PilB-like protein
MMQDFKTIEGANAQVIMGRFKAAAELPSGGSFVPTESLYTVDVDGESRKARVALFRDHNAGDALVLRLPPTGELRSLEELGFGESNLALFHKLLRAANRMVLIAGPMGSGKTTTAHAALKQVTTPERTVWSVEDPVERDLPGVVQLEIDESNGAGFHTLLPVLVRSDYDTLFLGEIRDKATAAAGVRQSKAGRQVITTIHANDNVTALLRLIELAEDSALSCMDAVRGVVSQRLMRRLNPEWEGGSDVTHRYKGRVPVHEVLIINDELTEAVMRNRPISEIKMIAASASESTFEIDSQRLIDAGITDEEEVRRVLGE